MYKELTMKIRQSLKEQWFYHIVIGVIFLIYTAIVILGNGIFLNSSVKMLGALFLLTGIGNLMYSFSGIGEREFHWGEILFWGLIEISSGWILISGKLLSLEQELIQEISLTVEKILASKVELQGYLVMFYIGTFLMFRGINHIVTTVYNKKGIDYNKNLVFIKRILVLDGTVDVLFGLLVSLTMYLNQNVFIYIIFGYILITSVLTILFGLASKYSSKLENEKIENEKETTLT
ncbi:MAG: hypothetical protein ACRCZR_07825 [Cetobacterium sp.]